MNIFNVFSILFLTSILIGCDGSATSEVPANQGESRIVIPMSDSHENNRYFLADRINEDGIEKIKYIRKGNESNVYGRMEIKCQTNKIRKVSTEDQSIIDSLDIGKWYTPTPDWTDKDIVNFICN